MHTIVIDLSPETYKRLKEKAQNAGQAVEVLSRELLETALASPEVGRRQTARTVLRGQDVRVCSATRFEVRLFLA